MEDKITENFYVENCLYNNNAVNSNYNTENKKIYDCVPHEASDDSMLQTIPKDKQKATTPIIPRNSSLKNKKKFHKKVGDSEDDPKKEKNQFKSINLNKKSIASDTEDLSSSSGSTRNLQGKDGTRFIRKASVKSQETPTEHKVTKRKIKSENKENTKNLEGDEKMLSATKIKEIEIKNQALEKSEIAAINALVNLSNIPFIRKHDCTFRLPPTHLVGEYLRCENCYTLPNHNKVIRLLICTETGDFRTIAKLEKSIVEEKRPASSTKRNDTEKACKKAKKDNTLSSSTEVSNEKKNREDKKKVSVSTKSSKKIKMSSEKKVEATKDEVRKYECDLCNSKFTSSFGLKYHKENGHTSEKENVKKPYVCPVKGCNKKYKNNNGLKYHLNHNHTYTAKTRKK